MPPLPLVRLVTRSFFFTSTVTEPFLGGTFMYSLDKHLSPTTYPVLKPVRVSPLREYIMN